MKVASVLSTANMLCLTAIEAQAAVDITGFTVSGGGTPIGLILITLLLVGFGASAIKRAWSEFIFAFARCASHIDENIPWRAHFSEINLVFENQQWTIDLLKNTIADQNGKLLYSSKTESSDLIKKQMI